MSTYHYKQVETQHEIGSEGFQAILDKMGDEHWELISVIPHQKAQITSADEKFRFTDPALEAQYQNKEVTYLIFLKRCHRIMPTGN